jgi:cytochrome P450
MTTLVAREAPTAPGDLPLLGHSLSLLRRDRIGYLSALRSVGDIVRLRIGSQPFLLLNSPDLVREVLVAQAKSFDRGRIFDKARPYVGDGLFTAAGAEHNRQRRMVQPAFHNARIERAVGIMSAVARAHVEGWRTGATIDADREMHVLASDLIGRTMFRAPEADEVVRLARDELPALLRGLGQRTLLPDVFTRVPTPVNRRFDAACANLRDAAQRLVAVYRAKGEDLGDFVSMLLAARDARTGARMSDTEIRDQIMTLLISGIETPATVLTWALYELARNPDIRTRLAAEVATADRHGWRVTEAFVRENLRLHHPLWILMRRCVAPVTIGGVRILPGTEVIYSPVAMHRDPALFPDPLRLDPDRWLGEGVNTVTHRGFVPFGLGNRQCIGDAFAVTMLTTVVASVVAGCRLTPPAGFRPKTIVSGIVHLAALPMTVTRPS